MLAFSNDYYELIFRATQSVELFCAYFQKILKRICLKMQMYTVKELEADKLIVRTEYPQIPPKVEYTLSERGKTLMTVLDQLCVWGEENRLTE